MADETSDALICEPSLLNLNDDCLLEVFSWLPLLDLCTIRNLCSRLRKLTGYYFARTHKSLNFNSNVIKDDKYEPIKKEEILKILSSFGQQVDALTLNQNHFSADSQSDVLLPMLDAFCSQRCLQHLKLVKFAFNDGFIMNRFHPFENVERLTLDNCTSDDVTIDELIKKCPGLSHLELIRYNNIDGAYLKQTYPMLQGFTLKSGSYPYSSELIEIFLTKNHQLKALNISECHVLDDDIFKTIADHLNDLETLTFRSGCATSNHTANLMRLLELQKLRELEVVCYGNAIDEFLNGLTIRNQLGSLGLACINVTDGVCNAIGRLKNLQNLKLVQISESKESAPIKSIAAQLPNLKQFHVASSDSVTFEHIIDFIENAPKLENVLLSSCENIIPFGETQFNRLVETCAKRDDELKLTVHIDFDDFDTMKNDIDEKLRQKHSNIVQLIELSAEVKDSTAFREPSGYYAEEGGALDYDLYGDVLDFDDEYDDYDDYDDFEEEDDFGIGDYF